MNTDTKDVRFFITVGTILILAGWKSVELIGWCFWTAFHYYK